MRARDIMTTPVVTLRDDMSIKDAAAALLRHRISGAPVVDDADRLIGMVTEADLIRLETTPDPRTTVRRRGQVPQDVPRRVGEVMSRAVVAVDTSADVADVSRELLQHGFRALPVVDGEKPVGIIARRDILRVLARADAAIAADLQHILDTDRTTYGCWSVTVHDGVATLTGHCDTSAVFAELVARTVPGLVGVRFESDSPLPQPTS